MTSSQAVCCKEQPLVSVFRYRFDSHVLLCTVDLNIEIVDTHYFTATVFIFPKGITFQMNCSKTVASTYNCKHTNASVNRTAVVPNVMCNVDHTAYKIHSRGRLV